MKTNLTATELQAYCSNTFGAKGMFTDIAKLQRCIDLAAERGAKTKKQILRESVNFLFA